MSAGTGDMALLIDADNVSAKIIAGLMVEIANYGSARVRRIYGDWTTPNLQSWKHHLLEHSIIPIQQFAYTTGKNATDGAMIIDAMDLLYTGRFSSFCLVSSDSDFTRLAARIREQGVTVYGFGERKTPSAFVRACDQFVYFDVLLTTSHSSIPETTAGRSAGAPTAHVRPQEADIVNPPAQIIDQATLDTLGSAIMHNVRYQDDFANLAEVGHYLRKIAPDLNARNYGYVRLKDFVEASGMVEVRMHTIEGKPPIALVRLKTTGSR